MSLKSYQLNLKIMTTLAKTECEAILERLRDKSLTDGCILRSVGISGLFATIALHYKTPGFLSGDMYLLSCKDGNYGNWDLEKLKNDFEVIGHPVLKCDIEQKLLDAYKPELETDALSEIEFDGGQVKLEAKLLKLSRLWQPFGFKTRLQSILNLIEWECLYLHSNGRSCKDYEGTSSCLHLMVKPSPAANLFLFLKQINL